MFEPSEHHRQQALLRLEIVLTFELAQPLFEQRIDVGQIVGTEQALRLRQMGVGQLQEGEHLLMLPGVAELTHQLVFFLTLNRIWLAVGVQGHGQLAIELLQAGFIKQRIDLAGGVIRFIVIECVIGKGIVLVLIDPLEIPVKGDVITFLTCVAIVLVWGLRLSPSIEHVVAQQVRVAHECPQLLPVVGGVAAGLHQHGVHEIALLLDHLLIHECAAVGLQVDGDGFKVQLPAKRVGLEVAKQLVDPVMQGLALPLGKALARREGGEALAELIDEGTLLALERFDLVAETVIDSAPVAGELVHFGLLLLDGVPVTMKQVERGVGAGARRGCRARGFFAAWLDQGHIGRLLGTLV